MSYFNTLINLSTALIFAQVFQIILTCLLAFAFTHFMTVLHCSVPTTAGLLAGFITLPTVVQLKTAQIKMQTYKTMSFTIWYKRLAICTCTILQSVSFSLALVNLFAAKSCKDTFMKIMHDYGNKQSAKSIVDNVQWFIQCCGAAGYKD
ncbi:uncharacterized protein, partial [Atheta coriaria]|uniref:uncharacterized protein n=1 Tax=Dalotia coriaria TaxID=877792 RepID=UPI0031F36F27